MRFSTTLGPGKTARHGKMSILSQIIEGAHMGKAVKIEKGGDQKDDIIYTKDAAQSIYLACTTPRLRYKAYNVGTGIGYILKDVAEEVKQLIPDAEI